MNLFSGYYSYKKKSFLIIAFVVDSLLFPVKFFIRSTSFVKLKLGSGDKILIFSLGGLGDAVLLEPLIRFLNKRHSTIKIDVITNDLSAKVLKLIPGIDEIIIFPDFKKGFNPGQWIKFWYKNKIKLLNSYKVATDTNGDPLAIIFMLASRVPCRAGFVNGGLGAFLHIAHDNNELISRTKQLLSFCDGSEEDSIPKIELSSGILKSEAEFINQIESNDSLPRLGIHLGAGEATKIFSLDSWIKILNSLIGRYKIFYFGSLDDKKTLYNIPSELSSKIIDLSGIPFNQVVSGISKMSLFIGHDSGLTHIASAMSVKSLCLFSLVHDPDV
ncbi:MAG: glycosyltransferase family 9 protein [Candidatus Falkowbacteria bacterium]|nr:glycosyltransferase family 9 protein [Candidatus Falkowbacteria bacterium]